MSVPGSRPPPGSSPRVRAWQHSAPAPVGCPLRCRPVRGDGLAGSAGTHRSRSLCPVRTLGVVTTVRGRAARRRGSTTWGARPGAGRDTAGPGRGCPGHCAGWCRLWARGRSCAQVFRSDVERTGGRVGQTRIGVRGGAVGGAQGEQQVRVHGGVVQLAVEQGGDGAQPGALRETAQPWTGSWPMASLTGPTWISAGGRLRPRGSAGRGAQGLA